MLSLRAAWRHRGGAPGGERPTLLGAHASQGVQVERLPALRPPHVEGKEREEGVPGADQRIRAAERWLAASW